MCSDSANLREVSALVVAAVDPIASMQAIQNPELAEIAQQVQAKLKHVISSL